MRRKGPLLRLSSTSGKEVMSQIDRLRADNRRPVGGTPAITPSTHISAAVAKVTALALGGLVCLAFGSHVIRADTLSGIDGFLGPARPAVDGASVREESTSVPGSSIASSMRRSGRSYLNQAYESRMAGQMPLADPPVPSSADPSALHGLSPLPTGSPSRCSEHLVAADSGPTVRQPDWPRPMPSRPSVQSLAAERPVRLPSTGVRQAGAITVEETTVDDNVARAHPEPMQEGSQPKQASRLLQPREISYLRPERVAFQDTLAGGPIPFSVEPGPLGNESGMSLGACGMDLPPIGAVTTDIRPSEGDLPFDCARTKLAQLGQVSPGEPACRGWPQILYPWEATSYCHRPLYFEEINLERYGYTWCDHRCGGVPAALVQPVLSGAHFFATVPLLPYKMAVDPACECIYTLGHYRPGSPVPHQIHRFPLRPVAGGVEAVAITGLIYAIP